MQSTDGLVIMHVYWHFCTGMGQMAGGVATRSAIYSSYLHQGRPRPCSGAVAEWLLQPRAIKGSSSSSGASRDVDGDDGVRYRSVRRVVVGHQPHADAPLVLQVQGLQVRL